MILEDGFSKEEYRIGEVARMVGVTSDTLRFYEEKGLFEGSARNANGYRLFTDDDVRKLQDMRFYRSLEVPIRDIRKLVESPSPDTLDGILDAREAEIHRSLARERLMLERINAVRQYSRASDEYEIRWFPSYYRILLQPDKDIFDVRSGIMEEYWMEYFFAFHGGFFVEQAWVVDQQVTKCTFGFMIDRFTASEINMPQEMCTDCVPAKRCVNTVLRVDGPLRSEMFEPALGWIREKNLGVAGDIVGRVIASFQTGTCWQRMYDLWIPVEQAR